MDDDELLPMPSAPVPCVWYWRRLFCFGRSVTGARQNRGRDLLIPSFGCKPLIALRVREKHELHPILLFEALLAQNGLGAVTLVSAAK